MLDYTFFCYIYVTKNFSCDYNYKNNNIFYKINL